MKSIEELLEIIDTFKHLMELEEEAETKELLAEINSLSVSEAEKRGLLVSRLEIFEHDFYFGGRYFYRFRKNNQTAIGFSRISPGCIISLVISETKEEILKAIVQTVTRSEIKIISEVQLKIEELKLFYEIHINADNITYKRIKNGLIELQKNIISKSDLFLIHILRTGEINHFKFMSEPIVKNYNNSYLNLSQNLAIEKVLSGLPLTLIHGPPGTGKTRTVLHLIKELVKYHKKVLVCAGTNTATDLLAEGLLAMDIKTVRLGHPARVSENLFSITLEKMLDKTNAGILALKLEKELSDVLRQKDKRIQKGKFLDKEEFQSEKNLIISYRKEIQRLNHQSLLELFNENVVFCTTASNAGSDDIKQFQFDYVIIDEAAQLIEPICYLPLLRGNRFVLSGDHLQLPPTIISKEASAKGLSKSFFEKLMHTYQSVSVLLNTQYRMHVDIAGFSSAYFYKSELLTDDKTNSRETSLSSESLFYPLKKAMFIDTAGADYEETFIESRKSYINKGEGQVIQRLVLALLNDGLLPDSIGIIVPYRTQAEFLTESINNENIEVSTVDSFQGREKECIIVGLTRSNASQKIGFLSEERRLNVALTRAKSKLIVIGDSSTLSNHQIFSELLTYSQNLGGYHSIWEFSSLMAT